MKIYAITGLLGAGKTTATSYLKEQGFPVLDVDQVSKIVVDKDTEEGREGFTQIYKAFGSTVLDKLGKLDRGALRKRLMLFPHEKEKLEAILNPLTQNYVRKEMTRWKAEGVELGFLEGTRIFEGGIDKVVVSVIRLTAPENERIKRLIKRDSMGKEEVTLFVQMQDVGMMERFSKIEWKNDKAVSVLYKQIDAFLDKEVGPAQEA
jgi:dephospho-CoA kinase